MRPSCLFILFAVLWLFQSPLQGQQAYLRQALADYVSDKPAQIGVALIVEGRDTVCVNDSCRYPLMSVFKLHQALAVAHGLRVRGWTLDTPVCIRQEDLKPDTYSPLRDKYPEGGVTLRVRDLLSYTLQWSDNNACDILFDRICGVEETERYMHELGIVPLAIVADEAEMHRSLGRCYDNWSTPLAVARLLEMLFTHPVFADSAEEGFIRKMLLECETGKERLAAPLEGTGTAIGHKTGTGDQNVRGEWIGVNDAGFIRLPDGRHYTLVVLVKDSRATMEETCRYMADISSIVLRALTGGEKTGRSGI